jgi:hypothetical protein
VADLRGAPRAAQFVMTALSSTSLDFFRRPLTT